MTQSAAHSRQRSDTADRFTPDSARQTLDRASAVAGLDAAGAELVRIGSNAVYRLAVPIVVRIAPDLADLDEARKQIVVARWLQGDHYPAVRALGGVNQPVVVDDRVVTFWVSFGDRDEFAPIEDVARLIRELHQLPPPEGFQLPAFDKFTEAYARIDELTAVSPDDRDYLRRRLHEVEDRFRRLDFELPRGPIHGDANVGNTMLDSHRNALLIDLDSFCVGPREWDLSTTAFYFDRLGWHTEAEYRTFAEIYGWDIMQWPGYSTLADMHEVLMTSWLASKAAHDDQYAAETHKRIDAIRAGKSKKDWQPI